MQRRRNVTRLILAGTLMCVTCAMSALIAINAAPRLLSILLGLDPIGRLESQLPHDPAPLTLDGSHLDRVQVFLPPRLVEPLDLTPADLGGATIIGSTTTSGTSTYLLTMDEASFNRFLRRWFLPDGAIGDRYRDLWIDLQPGGLILHADVNLGLRWQRMGLLLLQDEMALRPLGLVLRDKLYTLPDGGLLAQIAPRVESYSKRTLEALALTGPLPGEAHVSQMRFHANRIEFLAQTTDALPPQPDTGWQPLEPGIELRQLDVATGSVSERLTIVRLAPTTARFRVHYAPANPRLVSEWAAWLQHPLLVVNAGYFTPENEAIGLLVSDGRRWGAPFEDFAGMFVVTADGGVDVRWLQEWPYNPEEPLAEAVQSFPVLVKPGGVMGFPAEADEGTPARRTVVAQDRSGNILFVTAPRGYLSLHELAIFLADSDLEIDTALNLDGGGSTGLWLEAGESDVAIDSSTPVPSVIVAEKR